MLDLSKYRKNHLLEIREWKTGFSEAEPLWIYYVTGHGERWRWLEIFGGLTNPSEHKTYYTSEVRLIEEQSFAANSREHVVIDHGPIGDINLFLSGINEEKEE